MQIPLFPLKSIFFPGETVPLHIFEDRYKQLIQDCRNEAITFGIPVFIYDQIAYGTEVQLVEIVNTYDSGEMDVVCVGRQVFKILSFENEMNGKLYPGGNVEFLEGLNDATDDLKIQVLDGIKELYTLMDVSFTPMALGKFNMYSLIHKIGLSYEQEYQLLQMPKESERLEFVSSHLSTTITVLNELDRTKGTIKMNGDFKNFDPLDFEDFKI
ncbi:LON peptidase substrate-binding domain-containing protein [Maribacter sp. HTCC2170]|uniref:LON peptidase substrate-binding domain-containing protein n=1 Tax=Maribacter sp. (strain HTCC2170 / KCCM 42371) TaxID=313603 RepID=UPI00006B2163|nr:LON peptidase substrate-binding domain-containing protein [Maribacter sp. HTCC2170]EAR00189.1 ATP-dependent protease La domain protein [Maribacter sp. HTCC2170]